MLTRVADERYPARVATIAAQITAANDQPTVHTLFLEGVTALGATSAVFVSFVRDDGDLAACRFMLACDPAWARLYVQEGHFVHDPWLAYAAHHSEPIVASALNLLDNDHRRVIDLAERAGFVSAVLVPAAAEPFGELRGKITAIRIAIPRKSNAAINMIMSRVN